MKDQNAITDDETKKEKWIETEHQKAVQVHFQHKARNRPPPPHIQCWCKEDRTIL